MVNKEERPFGHAVELAQARGIRPKTTQSLNWYKQYTVKHFSAFNSWQDVKNQGETLLARHIEFGGVYTFMYSPKHKETLPYYDSTPLVIPFKDEGATFMAFNLHYLPLPYRALVLDLLYKITTNSNSKNQKLNAKYEVIMSLSKSNLFKPCIKRYLKSHMKSRLLEFKPEHWEIAIFLPIASFHKKGQAFVHSESMKQANVKKRKNR